jgi:hypothetical protein
MNLGPSKCNVTGQMDLKKSRQRSRLFCDTAWGTGWMCEWSEMRTMWWVWKNTASRTLMEETCMVRYLHSRKQPTINNVMLNVSREITVNKASSVTVISARKQIISELQQPFIIKGKISRHPLTVPRERAGSSTYKKCDRLHSYLSTDGGSRSVPTSRFFWMVSHASPSAHIWLEIKNKLYVCVCVGFVMCGCFGNMYTVLWLRFFLTWQVFLTLTKVFPCFFLSCKANVWVKLVKTGHGPHSSTLVVICVVRLLFVLFYELFVCKCVLPPGDNPIAVNKYIICHIISSKP